MAFQAGIINIGGFMACHRFVSHITGFATFYGHEKALPDPSHAAGMLAVPFLFLLGVMVSGQLVDIRLRLQKKPKYFISFGLIFLLLAVVFIGGVFGFFGVFGQPLVTKSDYFLLGLLCFVCGLQNGTITSVSRSVIRTTHLTGLTTDLGIGLVRLINHSRIKGPIDDEIRATLMRIGIIFFFGLGSVVGGVAFRELAYFGFALPLFTSGCLFLAMLYFQFLKGFFP